VSETTVTADLWCIHLQGPDDLIAAPSKERAEERAAALNVAFDQDRDSVPEDRRHFYPHLNAAAVPWQNTAERHEIDLEENWDEWWPTCQACGRVLDSDRVCRVGGVENHSDDPEMSEDED